MKPLATTFTATTQNALNVAHQVVFVSVILELQLYVPIWDTLDYMITVTFWISNKKSIDELLNYIHK